MRGHKEQLETLLLLLNTLSDKSKELTVEELIERCENAVRFDYEKETMQELKGITKKRLLKDRDNVIEKQLGEIVRLQKQVDKLKDMVERFGPIE